MDIFLEAIGLPKPHPFLVNSLRLVLRRVFCLHKAEPASPNVKQDSNSIGFMLYSLTNRALLCGQTEKPGIKRLSMFLLIQ